MPFPKLVVFAAVAAAAAAFPKINLDGVLSTFGGPLNINPPPEGCWVDGAAALLFRPKPKTEVALKPPTEGAAAAAVDVSAAVILPVLSVVVVDDVEPKAPNTEFEDCVTGAVLALFAALPPPKLLASINGLAFLFSMSRSGFLLLAAERKDVD